MNTALQIFGSAVLLLAGLVFIFNIVLAASIVWRTCRIVDTSTVYSLKRHARMPEPYEEDLIDQLNHDLTDEAARARACGDISRLDQLEAHLRDLESTHQQRR